MFFVYFCKQKELTQGLTSSTTILFCPITSVIDLNLTPYKLPLYSPCSKYSFCLMPFWIWSRVTKLYFSLLSSAFRGRLVSTWGRWNRAESLNHTDLSSLSITHFLGRIQIEYLRLICSLDSKQNFYLYRIGYMSC